MHILHGNKIFKPKCLKYWSLSSEIYIYKYITKTKSNTFWTKNQQKISTASSLKLNSTIQIVWKFSQYKANKPDTSSTIDKLLTLWMLFPWSQLLYLNRIRQKKTVFNSLEDNTECVFFHHNDLTFYQQEKYFDLLPDSYFTLSTGCLFK